MTTEAEKDRLHRLVERLHELVNRLPEGELATAARVLEALVAVSDRVTRALVHAPEDDEPETEAERAAVAVARAELEEGQGVPLDAARRELGL